MQTVFCHHIHRESDRAALAVLEYIHETRPQHLEPSGSAAAPDESIYKLSEEKVRDFIHERTVEKNNYLNNRNK